MIFERDVSLLLSFFMTSGAPLESMVSLFVRFDEATKTVPCVPGDLKLTRTNKMTAMLILCTGVIYVLYHEFKFILSKSHLNNKILMTTNTRVCLCLK